ncbi:sporulation protein YunB [Paenibacillus sp. CAU 1782]
MAKWGKRKLLPRLVIDLRPWRGKRQKRSPLFGGGSGNRPGKGVRWGSGGKQGGTLLSRGAGSKPPKPWGKPSGGFFVSSTLGGKPRNSRRPAPAVAPRPPGARRPVLRKRTIVLLFLVSMLLFSVPSFVFIERNLRPPLMNIAKVRIKQVATQAINKAITEQVARHSETEKLIEWKMNDNGKISGFMLNYGEHMAITSETIKTVQSTLGEIKNIPEHIPIGHALNSAIISSFGPRVPVKFEPVGAVKVELGTRERNSGINMVLVEVYITVTTEVSIIIPFDTAPELVQTEIPISYLLVVGDVPMYYYDGSGKPVGESAPQAPNISVPLVPGTGISSSGNKEESGGEGEGHSSGGLQMESE